MADNGGVRISNREIFDSVQELKQMMTTVQVEVAHLKEGRLGRAKSRLAIWTTVGGWALGLPLSILGLVK